MATANAIMEIQVDVSQANKSLDSVDRKLDSIKSTSQDTSSTLRRLEGTFARIEKTMASVERTMKSLEKISKVVALSTMKMSKGFTGLNQTTTSVNKTLKSFSGNISTISKRYDTLLRKNKALTKQIDDLKKSAKSASTALGGLGNQQKKTGDIFAFTNKIFKDSHYIIQQLVIAAAAFVTVDLASSLIRITDSLILMRNKLGTVNSEIGKLNNLFNMTFNIAQQTRTGLAAVANLASRLGRNSQQLKNDMSALNDVVTAINQSFQISGATAEEARNAIVQLSQAFASGRLQGDELRSMLELAPEAAKKMSKAMGISTGVLRKFASEGLITTELMVAAFRKAAPEIEAEFKKINGTIAQSMDVLRNSIIKVINDNEQFTIANQRIAASIEKFALKIQKSSGAAKALASVVDFLSKNFETFVIVIGGALAGLATFLTVLASIKIAMLAVSGPIGILATGFALLGIGIAGVIVESVNATQKLESLENIQKRVNESTKDLKDETERGQAQFNLYGESIKETQVYIRDLKNEMRDLERQARDLNFEIERGEIGFVKKFKDLLGPKIGDTILGWVNTKQDDLNELNAKIDTYKNKIEELTKREENLKKIQAKSVGRDLEEEAKKLDPQKMLLDSLTTTSKAIQARMQIVAEASRKEFDLAFSKPLDVNILPVQKSLTRFTENFSKEVLTAFQKYTPGALPSFDKTLFIKDAETVLKTVGNDLRNITSEQLQKGLFDVDAIIKSLMKDKSLQDLISGKGDQSSPILGDILDKVIRQKLSAELDTLVEDLKNYQLQIEKIIAQENRLAEDMEMASLANLSSSELSLKLYKEGNSELKIKQSLIDEDTKNALKAKRIELQRSGILMKENGIIAQSIIKEGERKKKIEEINLALERSQQIREKTEELVDVSARIGLLYEEQKLLESGSSEYEAMSRTRKKLNDYELESLRRKLEQKGVSEDQVNLEVELLRTKQNLLDMEKDITQEMMNQRDIRNAEKGLEIQRGVATEKERLLIEKNNNAVSVFLENLVSGTNKYDEAIKNLERSADTFRNIDISMEGIKLTGAGGMSPSFEIDKEYYKARSDQEKKNIDARLEVANLEKRIEELRSKNTVIKNNEKNWLVDTFGDSLFGKLFLSAGSKSGMFQQGGLIKGNSHSKGGVKGVLNGQPIELEGGEYVISKDAVTKYGVSLFEGLNARKFQNGGLVEALYRQGNVALKSGNVDLYKRISSEVDKLSAENKQRRLEEKTRRQTDQFSIRNPGVKTFDTKGNVTYADESGKIIKEFVGFVKEASVAVEANKNSVEEQTKGIVSSADGLDLFRNQIKKLPNAQEQATFAINKVTEKFKNVGRTLDELSEIEREALFSGDFSPLEMNSLGEVTPDMKKKGVTLNQETEASLSQMMLGGAAAVLTGGVVGTGDVIKELQNLLNQNERFRKAREKFEQMFLKVFNGFAEGLGYLMDALYDAISPVTPILDMIGGFIRDIMRTLTPLMSAIYEILEPLKRVFIVISGVLQVIVGIFSLIFQGIADFLTSFVGGILGNTTDEYKALPLLRAEAEVLSEMENSLEGMVDILKEIDDVIYEITSSTLNLIAPSIKLDDAEERYNQLFAAATSITASDEDINAFTSFAQEYLQFSQDLLKSSSAYQRIYTSVLADLESLQSNISDKVGEDITDTIRKAIYDLAIVGSDLDVYLTDLVSAYQGELITYQELVDTIAYKLSQVQEDIEIKDFAEFGQISGNNISELVESYGDFVERELDRFNQARGDALSASTLAEDLAYLYGVGTEQTGIYEDIVSSGMSAQRPAIGDVTGAPDPVRDGGGGDDSLPDFSFMDINLLDFVERIFGPIFQAIADGILLIWNNLKAGWDALVQGVTEILEFDLAGWWRDFSAANNLPDLTDFDLAADYADFADRFKLPDLTGVDLSMELDNLFMELNGIFSNAFPDIDLTNIDLASDFSVWFSGFQSSIEGGLQTLVNNVTSAFSFDISGIDIFGKFKSTVEDFWDRAFKPSGKIQLLPNPFHQFKIGPQYLIEFAKGGEIKGPSHAQGGVPAFVQSSGMPIELEGGEYIIKKDTVQKYGTRFMEDVNQGKVPKFQRGGSTYRTGTSTDGSFTIGDQGIEATNSSVLGTMMGTGRYAGISGTNPNSRAYMTSTTSKGGQAIQDTDPKRMLVPSSQVDSLTLLHFDVAMGGLGKELMEFIGLPYGVFFEAKFPDPDLIRGGLHGNDSLLREEGGIIPKFANGGIAPSRPFENPELYHRGDKTFVDENNSASDLFVGISSAKSSMGSSLGFREERGEAAFGVSIEDSLTNMSFASQFNPGGVLGLLGYIFTEIWGGMIDTVKNFDFSGGMDFGGLGDTEPGYGPFGGWEPYKADDPDPTHIVGGTLPSFFKNQFGGRDSYDNNQWFEDIVVGSLGTLVTANLWEMVSDNVFREMKLGGRKNPLGLSKGSDFTWFINQLFSFGTIDNFSSPLGRGLSTLLLPAFLWIYGQNMREELPEDPKEQGKQGKNTGGVISYEDWKTANNYASGGMIGGGLAVGPSHASGMLGLDGGGNPFLFEGGEYIFNRRTTDRIGKTTLDALNSGKMPEYGSGGILGALLGAGIGTAIGYASGLPSRYRAGKNAPYGGIIGAFIGGLIGSIIDAQAKGSPEESIPDEIIVPIPPADDPKTPTIPTPGGNTGGGTGGGYAPPPTSDEFPYVIVEIPNFEDFSGSGSGLNYLYPGTRDMTYLQSVLTANKALGASPLNKSLEAWDVGQKIYGDYESVYQYTDSNGNDVYKIRQTPAQYLQGKLDDTRFLYGREESWKDIYLLAWYTAGLANRQGSNIDPTLSSAALEYMGYEFSFPTSPSSTKYPSLPYRSNAEWGGELWGRPKTQLSALGYYAPSLMDDALSLPGLKSGGLVSFDEGGSLQDIFTAALLVGGALTGFDYFNYANILPSPLLGFGGSNPLFSAGAMKGNFGELLAANIGTVGAAILAADFLLPPLGAFLDESGLFPRDGGDERTGGASPSSPTTPDDGSNPTDADWRYLGNSIQLASSMAGGSRYGQYGYSTYLNDNYFGSLVGTKYGSGFSSNLLKSIPYEYNNSLLYSDNYKERGDYIVAMTALGLAIGQIAKGNFSVFDYLFSGSESQGGGVSFDGFASHMVPESYSRVGGFLGAFGLSGGTLSDNKLISLKESVNEKIFEVLYETYGTPFNLLDLDYGDPIPKNPALMASGGSIRGGMASGPSHQSGMLGLTKSGTPFLFEGGEYIVNKKSAQKLGTGFLDRVNSYGGGGLVSYEEGGTIFDFLKSFGGTTIEAAGVDKEGNELAPVTLAGEMVSVSFAGPQPVFLQFTGAKGNYVNLFDITPVAQGKLFQIMYESVFRAYTSSEVAKAAVIAGENAKNLSLLLGAGIGAVGGYYAGGATPAGAIASGLGASAQTVAITGAVYGAYEGANQAYKGVEAQQAAMQENKAEGGYLLGPSHERGGIKIEAEGGEYVIRKNAVKKYGKSLFDALNTETYGGVFQAGGMVFSGRRDLSEELTGGTGTSGATGAVSGMGAGFGGTTNNLAGSKVSGASGLMPFVTYEEAFDPKKIYQFNEETQEFITDEAGNMLLSFQDSFTNFLPEFDALNLYGMVEKGLGGGAGGGGIQPLLEDAALDALEQIASQDFEKALTELLEEPAKTLRKWRKQYFGGADDALGQDFEKAARELMEYPADTLRKWRKQYLEKQDPRWSQDFGKEVEKLFKFPIDTLKNWWNSNAPTLGNNVRTELDNAQDELEGWYERNTRELQGWIDKQDWGKIGEFLDGGKDLLEGELDREWEQKIGAWADNENWEWVDTELAGAEASLKDALGEDYGAKINNWAANENWGWVDTAIAKITDNLKYILNFPIKKLEEVFENEDLMNFSFNLITLDFLSPLAKQFGIGPRNFLGIELFPNANKKADGGIVEYATGGEVVSGGLAKGPSHQGGMLGVTKGGGPFLFEGGEYILNKKTTAFFGKPFLDQINKFKSTKDVKTGIDLLAGFANARGDLFGEGGCLCDELTSFGEGDLVDFGFSNPFSTNLMTFPNILKSITGPDTFNLGASFGSGITSMGLKQNIFGKGGKLKEFGMGDLLNITQDVVGNPYEKNFINVKNPLGEETFENVYKTVTDTICRVPFFKEVCEKVEKTVLDYVRVIWKAIGPDRLKMGAKGNTLDMWNSTLYSNFGGKVLNELGIGSLPGVSKGEAGGFVFGPSHAAGGMIAELEGGEFVINKDSASEIGYGTLSSMNSSSDFTDSLRRSSSMNNVLLKKLIDVVDSKEMSVTFVKENGEEVDASSMKIRRADELKYRNATELA